MLGPQNHLKNENLTMSLKIASVSLKIFWLSGRSGWMERRNIQKVQEVNGEADFTRSPLCQDILRVASLSRHSSRLDFYFLITNWWFILCQDILLVASV